jgi:general secretion pathway protein N
MIRRCAWLIAAVFSISACGAEGQDAVVSSDLDRTGSTGGQRQLVAAENPDPRQPPLGANPLSRIPVSSLSVTRERPLFSVSRRPPAPPPAPTPPAHIEAPPPTESGGPPFTLSGTAIGGSRDVAVMYDETTKSFVRLHVGEAAAGWNLRAIDRRTVTLEKDDRIVVVSLPAPGPASSS